MERETAKKLMRRFQAEAQEAVSLELTTAAVHKELSGLLEQFEVQEEMELEHGMLSVMETTQDALVRQFFAECIPLAVRGDVEQIKQKFSLQLRQPRMEAYGRLETQLANLIWVCRTALAGKPHLGFLFNGLCSSREMTDIVACSPGQEFRQLL